MLCSIVRAPPIQSVMGIMVITELWQFYQCVSSTIKRLGKHHATSLLGVLLQSSPFL